LWQERLKSLEQVLNDAADSDARWKHVHLDQALLHAAQGARINNLENLFLDFGPNHVGLDAAGAVSGGHRMDLQEQLNQLKVRIENVMASRGHWERTHPVRREVHEALEERVDCLEKILGDSAEKGDRLEQFHAEQQALSAKFHRDSADKYAQQGILERQAS
jgi:hypothetical protein